MTHKRITLQCLTAIICLASGPLFAIGQLAQYSKRHQHSQTRPTEEKPLPKQQQLTAFSQVRSEILNMIGGAGKRVWLVTNYLTDGDIVSALYIAKYRKVSVSVLLGRRYANAYMSRLNFLKSQNIPVFLLPKHWSFPEPTALLTDERLVSVNGSLNFMDPRSRYTLTEHQGQEKMLFIRSFQQAIGEKVPAIPSPRLQTRSRRPHIADRENRTNQYTGETDGSFNYNRIKHPRRAPSGVSRKLPKNTILQKKLYQKSKE